MKTGTDVAAHCKMTPANITIAPTNNVTLRPNLSEIIGAKGRACAHVSTQTASHRTLWLTPNVRMWHRCFGPSLLALIDQISFGGTKEYS